jgi:hypothetical protein
MHGWTSQNMLMERCIGGWNRSVDCQYLHGKHASDASKDVKDVAVTSAVSKHYKEKCS